jgi:hypothetical protein
MRAAGGTHKPSGALAGRGLGVLHDHPGLAAGLVVLAALDRSGVWLHGRSGLRWYRDGHRPAPAAGFDELQAAFYSSNRHPIERRRAELMLRDDEHDGAPPRVRVDLDTGRAVITHTTRSPSTGDWAADAARPYPLAGKS